MRQSSEHHSDKKEIEKHNQGFPIVQPQKLDDLEEIISCRSAGERFHSMNKSAFPSDTLSGCSSLRCSIPYWER